VEFIQAKKVFAGDEEE